MALDLSALGFPPDAAPASAPPPLPPPPTPGLPKPMALALLAGMLAGGKRTTGLGAGVLAQHETQVQDQQAAAELATRQQLAQQAQQAELQQEQARRADARGQTLARTLIQLKEDLAKIPDDRDRAEALIDQYGQVLTLSGFPGFDGNALRQKGFRYYPASVQQQLYQQLETLFKANTGEDAALAMQGTVFYTDPKDPRDVVRPIPVKDAIKLAKYPALLLDGELVRPPKALTPAQEAGVEGAYRDALARLLAGGAVNTPDTREKARAQAVRTFEALTPAAGRAPTFIWATGPDGQPRRMTNQEAVAQGAAPPTTGAGGLATAQAIARNTRVAAAMNSVERLKSLAPVRTPGPQGILEGAAEVAKGYAGYSTKTRQFQALVGPTAMQMAVAVQGAANLSDTERETMARMLGTINTMDYESQMALLDHALDLIGSGGAVTKVDGVWKPITTAPPPSGTVPGGIPVSAAPVTVTAPNGKSYPFPDHAAADRFVADAKARGLWK